MTIEVGNIVEGVVTGVAKFGAFVQISDELTGLVHISEVSNDFVKEISDYVHEGDKVKVKVLSMDDKGKIALSMKEAEPKEQRDKGPEAIILTQEITRDESSSFDDMLSKFMKNSNAKIESAKQRKNVRQGKTRK